MNGLVVLRPEDAEFLATLHARCFGDAWDAAAIRGLLEDSKVLSLGAQSNGTITAFLIAQTVAGETDILTIATDPCVRRTGLASRLIEALVLRAGERGVSRIMLDVAEDNVAARQLYRDHGFVEDGRRPRYYRSGRDIPVDAILMSRFLGIPA